MIEMKSLHFEDLLKAARIKQCGSLFSCCIQVLK